MLKRVLGESGESSEGREEDKQSHHSDSIMECHKIPSQHTGTNTFLLKCSEYNGFMRVNKIASFCVNLMKFIEIVTFISFRNS